MATRTFDLRRPGVGILIALVFFSTEIKAQPEYRPFEAIQAPGAEAKTAKTEQTARDPKYDLLIARLATVTVSVMLKAFSGSASQDPGGGLRSVLPQTANLPTLNSYNCAPKNCGITATRDSIHIATCGVLAV